MFERDTAQETRPIGSVGRRAPQVPERVLTGSVHPEVRLAECDRGLGLAPRVTELLPDGQRPLQVHERLRVAQADQRVAELVQAQASPGRSPAFAALSTAMRCVVTQSAQLLLRLNSGNKVGGSRQAISCRPAAAAWRVAATMLARSSSYQASASSVLAKVRGG